MRFLTEDTEVTEEGLDQREGAVPIKAINAVSHRGHRGHGGRLQSGEKTVPVNALIFTTEITENTEKDLILGENTITIKATRAVSRRDAGYAG